MKTLLNHICNKNVCLTNSGKSHLYKNVCIKQPLSSPNYRRILKISNTMGATRRAHDFHVVFIRFFFVVHFGQLHNFTFREAYNLRWKMVVLLFVFTPFCFVNMICFYLRQLMANTIFI